MDNRYKIKTCRICTNKFNAYKTAKYCTDCRRKAHKVHNAKSYIKRMQDPDYRLRRKEYNKIMMARPETKKRQAEWQKNNKEKVSARSLKWYYANKEKVVLKRERQKLRGWGLTLDGYNKLSNKQNRVCAICKRLCTSGRKLAVDHNHKTNKIRGLLCSNCNQGLGKFFDNKDLLKRAIIYLSNGV